jgi:ferric enterobactin transport system permease protein
MRFAFTLLGLGLALLVAIALSLQVGASYVPLAEVAHALAGQCATPVCTLVTDARLPRTLAGLMAGIALGTAGMLMQTLTRNPLADPGVLGVNAGASFAIIVGIAFFSAQTPFAYLAWACAGALAAALLVTLTGMASGRRFSPVRLLLVGVALGAALEGLGSGISLLHPLVYDHVRYWQAGSLDIRDFALLHWAAPAIIGGVLLALGLARSLDSLGLGDDLAAALGTGVLRTQVLGLVCITVLCGATTALVGPVAFVGLMVPHMARRVAGPAHGRSLPAVLLITPLLLLLADTLGRVLTATELRVSIVTALLGAPVLVLLARRSRLVAL